MAKSITSVIIEYSHLVKGANLQAQIEQAYGPKGHGILFVNGIPGFPQQRKKTLPLFHKLANLPKDILKKYQRPEIYHSQGWSCGVEQFQGSYYVNCSSDESYQIPVYEEQYFSEEEKIIYCPNRWVEDIPEIEVNVKRLSKMMIDVGAMLALQIDNYARSQVKTYPEKYLHKIIRNGKSHIGRMLHYFPFENKGDTEDDWCGWHNDHGSLTALTSAIYTNEKGQEISFPVKSGGLFAKNRFADTAKIAIPQQMLAFQLGEATQIHSGGYLEATPHCVIRSDDLAGKKIARNTFALFMEPDPLEPMKVPEGINPESVSEKIQYKIPALKDRWDNGIFFKEFHSRTIKHYS